MYSPDPTRRRPTRRTVSQNLKKKSCSSIVQSLFVRQNYCEKWKRRSFRKKLSHKGLLQNHTLTLYSPHSPLYSVIWVFPANFNQLISSMKGCLLQLMRKIFGKISGPHPDLIVRKLYSFRIYKMNCIWKFLPEYEFNARENFLVFYTYSDYKYLFTYYVLFQHTSFWEMKLGYYLIQLLVRKFTQSTPKSAKYF